MRSGGWSSRPRGRPTGSTIAAVAGLAIFLAIGVGLVVSGLSGLHHVSDIQAHGVPVTAQVSASQSYGRDHLVLTYPTRSSRQEQGVADLGSASHYRTGEPVAAVYDPADPQVVALASEVGDSTGAYGRIAVGGLFLGMLLLVVVLSALSQRRGDRRTVRRVLGN